MATQINVTVGGGELPAQAKRGQEGNRWRLEERERNQQATAQRQAAEQQQQAAQATGADPRRALGQGAAFGYRPDELAANRFGFKADFFVISYGFTTGLDLDTRSRLVDPVTGARYGPVGWCKANDISAGIDQAKPIVRWAGDNTGTGVESFLFDFKQYKLAFPAARRATLDLSAFWFNDRGQNVVIEVVGYLGGEMVLNGALTTWENPTATKRYDKYEKHTSFSVVTEQGACIEGDFVTLVEIDVKTGRLVYTQTPSP